MGYHLFIWYVYAYINTTSLAIYRTNIAIEMNYCILETGPHEISKFPLLVARIHALVGRLCLRTRHLRIYRIQIDGAIERQKSVEMPSNQLSWNIVGMKSIYWRQWRPKITFPWCSAL